MAGRSVSQISKRIVKDLLIEFVLVLAGLFVQLRISHGMVWGPKRRQVLSNSLEDKAEFHPPFPALPDPSFILKEKAKRQERTK